MRLTVLCTVLIAAVPCAAVAQDAFPARSVRFIVPFPPAGPIDVLARLYAQRLSERWKRPVVIENRPGATGSVGTDVVVRSNADGYTLLFTVDLPIVMAPALIKTPYDPNRDLVPVAGLAEGMNLLAAHPSSGVSSLAELVAAAKAKPGSLTYASAGNASPGHICGELLAAASGTNLTHIPYKGAAPAGTAVLTGEVSMFCGPIAVVLPHVRTGKLRAIGVTGARAAPVAPEIAPLAAKYPSVVLTNWYAVFAPPNTQAAVTNFIRAEFQTVFTDPELKSRLTAIGLDARWIDSTELASMVKSDLAKWTRVVKTANIKSD